MAFSGCFLPYCGERLFLMKFKILILTFLISAATLSGCSGEKKNVAESSAAASEISVLEETGSAVELQLIKEEKPEIAEGFTIYDYEGGYKKISVKEDGREYLVIPEGKEVPSVDDGVKIIRKPLKNIYLAASAAMCQFDAIGATDKISFSGIEDDEWTIQSAIDAVKSGQMEYCGNYGSPDYEYLTSEGCDLAVENLMVLHKSEVIEKLEALGIPVFIDRSSGEENPLGRTEWVKVYGVLTDKEEEAEAAFEEQKAYVYELKGLETTGKKVASFYISSQGQIVVPKSGESLPRMIEMAGGEYIFSDLKDDSARSTVKMTMEEFLATAKDADIILYDGAIMPISNINELIDKNKLLSEFKAVKEGNVWYMEASLYQNASSTGNIVKNLRLMLEDKSGGEYIEKLDE